MGGSGRSAVGGAVEEGGEGGEDVGGREGVVWVAALGTGGGEGRADGVASVVVVVVVLAVDRLPWLSILLELSTSTSASTLARNGLTFISA